MWRCGSRRTKTEIARATRSDTRSDWSNTLGANYTYQLYLQYLGHAVYVLVYLFTDGQTQLADVPSPSGTVDATPELHT